MSEDPLYPLVPPEVEKKQEYVTMLKLIDKGMWKNVNLAKALHVDDETISIWKKTKPVKDIYTAAVLRTMGKRKDVELTLREYGIETPQEAPKTLVQINYQPIFGGKSLDGLPTSDSHPQDIQLEEKN